MYVVFLNSLVSSTGVYSSHSRPHRTRCQRAGEGDLSRHRAGRRRSVWVLLRREQLAGSKYERRSTRGQPPGGLTYCRRDHTRTRTSIQSSQEQVTPTCESKGLYWILGAWLGSFKPKLRTSGRKISVNCVIFYISALIRVTFHSGLRKKLHILWLMLNELIIKLVWTFQHVVAKLWWNHWHQHTTQMRSVTEDVYCSTIKASNIKQNICSQSFISIISLLLLVSKFITNPELPKKSKLCCLRSLMPHLIKTIQNELFWNDVMN